MTRILLSVPSFDRTVKSLTDEALGNLDRCGCEIVQKNIGGYGIERARNLMVKKALDMDCDYLLMVDSDMIPPKDGLANLLSHDVEVCLGWAVRGGSDDGLTSVIKMGTQGYHDSYYASEIDMMACDYRLHGRKSPLLEVKGCGMAFALLNTDVFRRFDEPWFKYVSYKDGSALGEDYYFCHKCHENNVRVWVDTRVGCGHIHDRILEAR